MTRLASELQRLYFPPGHPGPVAGDGRVRALVVELAAAAGWPAAARLWQGAQADLSLPAAAIAVSGSGYQLWWSLAEPVSASAAAALLQYLRRTYLADVRPEHVALCPAAAPGDAPWPRLPPQELAPGRWSAFVAPDLAAVFADEPWLDLPPNADAQAELLSRLHSVTGPDWQRALQRASEEAAAPLQAAPASAPAAADDRLPAPASSSNDPRGFLLATMNDPSVDLRLRIEAAKALLPYCGDRPAP